jgi:phosphate transport system protein
MMMRDAFHEEIDAIGQDLLNMAALVNQAMSDATKALVGADLALAEKVIAADDVIDQMQHDLDARTISLMARQQPVASDLRTLVTGLRMSADLERMGDMAHHIAKSARMRYPNLAIPVELKDLITQMGATSNKIITKLINVMKNRDLDKSLEIPADDDEMDKLHRQLMAAILSDSWKYDNEMAIDLTLIGRNYERCCDHAVSISRRIYYLVTGEYFSQQD